MREENNPFEMGSLFRRLRVNNLGTELDNEKIDSIVDEDESVVLETDSSSNVDVVTCGPKYNKKCVLSCILGIYGFCFPFLAHLLGLIFGISGLADVKRSENEKGKGFAIADIIFSSLGLLFFSVLIILFILVAVNPDLVLEFLRNSESFSYYFS